MAPTVPRLQLSHGQVLWTLAGGKNPPPALIDQLTYLRQLGIPFADEEKGQGRGKRLTYGFYHLIEVGLATEALRRGVPPRHLKMLKSERAKYRNLYRAAYKELAPAWALLEEDDPRSWPMFQDEYLVSFHGRYTKSPGEITLADPNDPATRPFIDLVGRAPGQDDYVVIQIKALVTRLLLLSKIAPTIKPGPKG
jgi:hypothetical protein